MSAGDDTPRDRAAPRSEHLSVLRPEHLSAPRRVDRMHVEVEVSQHRVPDVSGATETGPAETNPADEYRVDLERIRFSRYFGRLSAVTQVVPQTGVGPMMHNRLTHSLKVSAVARVIAANLVDAVEAGTATGRAVAALGGCDTVVAQAAGHAHDLGHPPFGHLGEGVLDRVARERLGLAEGFEGNAQSFRILVKLDTLGRRFPGLNLTAATRAAVLKYPWTRGEWTLGQPAAASSESADGSGATVRPRGVGANPAGAGKFSAYAVDLSEMEQALAAFPAITAHRQTIECAVMDLADDIAYAVHDLDDFVRAGVLQQSAIMLEFGAWLAADFQFSEAPVEALREGRREPGCSLELLWREMEMKDGWIADRAAFSAAVARVADEVGQDLLASPYDGGIASERAVSSFTRRWIEHLRTSVVVELDPHPRGSHVRLDQQAWHEVAVLKFVHRHFVLERTEHALAQRGQAKIIEDLVIGFDAWLTDRDDVDRAPRKLLEWVDQATDELVALSRDRPELVGGDTSTAGLRGQGRARAILDYVASLTDQQAIITHRDLTGA